MIDGVDKQRKAMKAFRGRKCRSGEPGVAATKGAIVSFDECQRSVFGNRKEVIQFEESNEKRRKGFSEGKKAARKRLCEDIFILLVLPFEANAGSGIVRGLVKYCWLVAGKSLGAVGNQMILKKCVSALY